ncbi:MAG: DUF3536 domain-containing protein [Chloroflexi bacterium]|nr:DUF3536 domain-containing protein [Chloroflexota bacterium]
MERYICIHGHFYQPPRENPWLEAIERQHSAYPYHDWNERITSECYAANATARIQDGEDRIVGIVNNYDRMSFNFGPTLLAWLQSNARDVYEAVLAADKESQASFSGHGSAQAQVYNHIIMPLANRRDKYTQVLWGLRDFESRFGRQPEGMWLPETAVDLESLDILAELGMKFTILAPHQAKRMRPLGAEEWDESGDGHIDLTRAYEVHLPSGRKLALFFYDDTIARAVAFEGLLSNGENLANRLASAFSEKRDWPQLVHIATDGESYGHHHALGDMALAYALHYIETKELARITNYGEFLAKHPPTHEVEVVENTSWSCVHGIERWHNNCGCNSGGHPGWTQAWRAPLRQAIDWLRDNVVPKYEGKARQFLKDPWAARNDYIGVVLDRSPESVAGFLARHATRELTEPERIATLKLLELQRHAMLMYTSCGWFFDELSGIETVQVIQYAGRVVQLARELFEENIEEPFATLLEKAKSNIAEHGDGCRIYDKFVRPAIVDLTKVAAHWAVSSLFEEYPAQAKLYCYSVANEDFQFRDCGKTRVAIGRARFASDITLESQTLSFGVLHFGDHNVNAGVRQFRGDEAYKQMFEELVQTCITADFLGAVRLLDKHFGTSTYSLKSLFRDEQIKVLDNILQSALAEVEAAYRQVYLSHYPLMRFLTDTVYPLPGALRSAAEFILNTDLSRALTADTPNPELVGKLLDDARIWSIQVDRGGLEFAFRKTLEKKMAEFAAKSEDVANLNAVLGLVTLAQSLPFPVNTRQVQNAYYCLLKTRYAELKGKAEKQSQAEKDWLARFALLGEKLTVRVT